MMGRAWPSRSGEAGRLAAGRHWYVLLLVLSLLLAACGGPITEPPMVAYLSLGTNPVAVDGSNHFEDDTVLVARGEDIGGRVLISINGNPLLHHSTGGLLTRLNQYLRAGENTISIRGTFDKALYLKIGETLNDNMQQVVLREKIEPQPGGDEQTHEFKFQFSRQQDLSIYKPGNEIPEDREAVKEQITEYARRINKAIDAKDGKALVKLTQLGGLMWIEQAYNAAPSHVGGARDYLTEYLSENADAMGKIDPDALRYEFGPRIVMVYVGFEPRPPHHAYAMVVDEGNETVRPALYMAFVDGEWLVWEFGHHVESQ